RQRADGIGGTGGTVLRILVVIEEDAVTLLFPPFRSGQSGCTALYCARQRNGRAADFSECPARFNTHIYMHAARTAGLGPSAKSNLFEQRLHLESNTSHIGPTDAGNRIQIDTQFVRLLKISGADRMRVQLNAT